MRNSDRALTPGVVVAGLVCATVMVLGVSACVTYLTQRGLDPDPLLKLVAEVGTAVSALGSLLVQLANRKTITKVERESGRTASALFDVADIIDERTARPLRTVPPPAAPRHRYPDTGAAPVASGS